MLNLIYARHSFKHQFYCCYNFYRRISWVLFVLFLYTKVMEKKFTKFDNGIFYLGYDANNVRGLDELYNADF